VVSFRHSRAVLDYLHGFPAKPTPLFISMRSDFQSQGSNNVADFDRTPDVHSKEMNGGAIRHSHDGINLRNHGLASSDIAIPACPLGFSMVSIVASFWLGKIQGAKSLM
jgi:hypothetical protein